MAHTDKYNCNSVKPEPPFHVQFYRKDRTETYRGDGFHAFFQMVFWSWGWGSKGVSASTCALAGYLLYAMISR